jgi:single-strand DNA-binding protein
MSRIINRFQLVGNTGTDAEIRFLPTNGNKVATIPLAVNSRYRKKDSNEVIERTDWFDIVFYGQNQIAFIEQWVKKGSHIAVSGSLRKESWDSKDRKDAEGKPLKDSRYVLIGDEIEMLEWPEKDSKPAPVAPNASDEDIPA